MSRTLIALLLVLYTTTIISPIYPSPSTESLSTIPPRPRSPSTESLCFNETSSCCSSSYDPDKEQSLSASSADGLKACIQHCIDLLLKEKNNPFQCKGSLLEKDYKLLEYAYPMRVKRHNMIINELSKFHRMFVLSLDHIDIFYETQPDMTSYRHQRLISLFNALIGAVSFWKEYYKTIDSAIVYSNKKNINKKNIYCAYNDLQTCSVALSNAISVYTITLGAKRAMRKTLFTAKIFDDSAVFNRLLEMCEDQNIIKDLNALKSNIDTQIHYLQEQIEDANELKISKKDLDEYQGLLYKSDFNQSVDICRFYI